MFDQGLPSTLSALTFRGLKANARLYEALSLPVISTGRSFKYYRNIFFKGRSRDQVLSELRGRRIVDVGCGLTPYVSDSMFQVCRKQGIDFFGVDPKFSDGFRPGLLDAAGIRAVGGRGRICLRARGLEKCFGASADDMPFEDESVDLVLSNFLLYAWIQDERSLEAVYREFHRVLKRGGEARIYPSPELRMDRIRNPGLLAVMDEFDIRQQFSARWLNLSQYPPAYTMTMKKK